MELWLYRKHPLRMPRHLCCKRSPRCRRWQQLPSSAKHFHPSVCPLPSRPAAAKRRLALDALLITRYRSLFFQSGVSGRAAGVGRALGVGVSLGVGLELGVGVGVAVGVNVAVAVGLAVGVGVGAGTAKA
jgi:hypothetical protein